MEWHVSEWWIWRFRLKCFFNSTYRMTYSFNWRIRFVCHFAFFVFHTKYKSSWTTHTKAKQATTAFHTRTIRCGEDILVRIDLVRSFSSCVRCACCVSQKLKCEVFCEDLKCSSISLENRKNRMENGKEAYRWRAFGTYATTAPLLFFRHTMHTKHSYTTHILDFFPRFYFHRSRHIEEWKEWKKNEYIPNRHRFKDNNTWTSFLCRIFRHFSKKKTTTQSQGAWL